MTAKRLWTAAHNKFVCISQVDYAYLQTSTLPMAYGMYTLCNNQRFLALPYWKLTHTCENAHTELAKLISIRLSEQRIQPNRFNAINIYCDKHTANEMERWKMNAVLIETQRNHFFLQIVCAMNGISIDLCCCTSWEYMFCANQTRLHKLIVFFCLRFMYFSPRGTIYSSFHQKVYEFLIEFANRPYFFGNEKRKVNRDNMDYLEKFFIITAIKIARKQINTHFTVSHLSSACW